MVALELREKFRKNTLVVKLQMMILPIKNDNALRDGQ